MVRGRNTKGMVVLLLLFMATLTNAAPTLGNFNKSFACYFLPTRLDLNTQTTFEINRNIELCNTPLKSISEEFHKPPVSFSASPDSVIGIKSLPVVPRAILMVLSGFFCVSLVKDHKFWLAVFISLLWAAQTGLTKLPKLTSHLNPKNHNKQSSPLDSIHIFGPEFPSISFSFKTADNTRLIYHSVGIFNRKQAISLLTSLPALIVKRSNLIELPHRLIKAKQNLTASKSTLISLSNRLILVSGCTACQADQSVFSSSEFKSTFPPRGPPYLA